MVTFMVYLFLTSLCIQFVFILGVLSRIFSDPPPPKPKREGENTAIPVSVIICAHQEASALKNHLPEILAQIYRKEDGSPNFEVLVVDDRSTDESQEVLQALAADYPWLRILRLDPKTPRRFPGKKDALSHGLAQARYDHILLTDADCRPRDAAWIKTMAAQAGAYPIICGPGLYEQGPGTLNALVQAETLHSYLMAYAGGAAGYPYMALGRNLFAHKSSWEAVQEHPLWKKTISGDDDLFMRLQPKGTPVLYLFDRQAQTLSTPPATWKDWLMQKQRHVSTGKYYRSIPKLGLGLYALSHAFCWWGFLWMFLMGFYGEALGLMGLRVVAMLIIWDKLRRRLDWPSSAYTWIRFDFFWSLYHLILAPYIFWKNQKTWNRSSSISPR